MKNPHAFKKKGNRTKQTLVVKTAPIKPKNKRSRSAQPAIVILPSLTYLKEYDTGLFDLEDALHIVDGDWDNCILIEYPECNAQSGNAEPNAISSVMNGDDLFLREIEDKALRELAKKTIESVRAAGVTGELEEKGQGRWVNSTINAFTLKAQKRKKNIAFTVYGSPETHENLNRPDFLKPDQNSYSRGWINELSDIDLFQRVALAAFERRSTKRTTSLISDIFD